jgi:alpha/beta superfamily hydrolase
MEEKVTFPVGDIALEGLLALPHEQPRIGIVVCHPHPLYGGEMHNNVVTALVRAFQVAGHATLRFNFRGVARSGGRHDDGNGEQDDVKGAVSCLLGRVSPPTVVVAGYSFGSIVGLKAGARDPRVSKLIGVALPIARRDTSFLEGVAKPKLLISGDRDDISPAAQLAALFARLSEPKQLAIVRGADHFFAGLERDVADAAVRFLDSDGNAGATATD